MAWYRTRFPASMTVGQRKAKALRTSEKLGRKQSLDPVVIEGPLAVTWWGKAWNRNLEAYADYSNRLPRGRSYARHGSVVDLRIDAGSISALVQGSGPRPYEVKISIAAMDAKVRALLVEACAGKLDSAEALLGGFFPEDMSRLLTAEKTGLFPRPGSIRFSCSCPDSASLCKHVAAALYGVGSRLDRNPAHFFRLRKIELDDLVSQAVKEETRKLLQGNGAGESTLMNEGDKELASLFGIDLRIAGEKKLPEGPGIPLKIPAPVAERKGRGKVVLAGRQSRAIQKALSALAILSDEISRLESDLKLLLE